MDDSQIIELYFARDEQAIHATDEKCGKKCLHTASNLLASRENSTECVNDIYTGPSRARFHQHTREKSLHS